MNRVLLEVVALSALGLSGCVDEPSFGRSDQAVYNGNFVDPVWREARYLVNVSQGACSGVLLSNTLVLTAGHCINEGGPSMLYLEYAGQNRLSDRVYRFGDGGPIDNTSAGGGGPGFYGIGADFAILDVFSHPFEVNGSTTGFGLVVEPDTALEIEGKTLQVYGQGFNEAAPPPFGEPGTWRNGEMEVTPTSFVVDDLFRLLPRNGTLQSLRPGDSGGPTFLEDEAGVRLIGIHSRGHEVFACDADQAQCDAFDQLVYPDLGGLTLAMDPAWDPDKTTEVFDVFPAELHVMREPDFDVNERSWAGTARVATKLCANRMYPGGHANGHLYQSKHGTTCSGKSKAVVLDARYNVVGPLGIYDLDEAEWGQAQVAANAACRQVGLGAAGYWTGFYDRGRTYGLVCLTGGYQNLVATWSQLNATGWRVDGVVQTPYAQALRAAHGFCTARGYATGYLMGTQTRDRYGVTCQSAR